MSTEYILAILKGDDTMQERILAVGRYYWVLVGRKDHEPEWQPARFTGMSADSVGATWDFIGYHSTDGHHFVDVLQIGGQIDGAQTLFKVSEALRTDEEAAP